MKSINFELTSPIKYANGSGNEVECNFIELREPTGKVSDIACAIEGLIQSALIRTADILDQDTIEQAKEAAQNKKFEPSDEEEMKDGDAILSLMAAGDVDMKKVVLYFRELFKVVAFMGGEKQITSARLDDMSHKDLRKMIGVYAANFILN